VLVACMCAPLHLELVPARLVLRRGPPQCSSLLTHLVDSVINAAATAALDKLVDVEAGTELACAEVGGSTQARASRQAMSSRTAWAQLCHSVGPLMVTTALGVHPWAAHCVCGGCVWVNQGGSSQGSSAPTVCTGHDDRLDIWALLCFHEVAKEARQHCAQEESRLDP
jgi:hypothetical protein